MENENILEILNNIDIICNIIEDIKSSFKNVIQKYEPYHHGDAYSYFLTGHCNIFIEILNSIFNNNMKVYISRLNSSAYDHVIAKIGDNFYDINGYLPPAYSDLDKYEEISYNEFLYIEDLGLIGNCDKTANQIIPDLANIGLETLNNAIQNRKR